MQRCGGGNKILYGLTLATGIAECLGFAGLVFGFASLVFVLKQDGYFSQMCVNATAANNTSYTGEGHCFQIQFECVLHLRVENRDCTAYLDSKTALWGNALCIICRSLALSICLSLPLSLFIFLFLSPSLSLSSLDCSGQDEHFSLVFTIASFLIAFLSLPNGYLFDRFGTMVTRLLGM